MSPQKLFFYHLPTRGQAGVKLGDVVLEICPRGNNKCSYYYIFVFMINVYIHSIIVLTENINTCVIFKLN